MKEIKLAIKFSIFLVIVVSFFAPYVVIETTSYSFFDLLLNGNYNAYFYFILISFLIILLSGISIFFPNKNSKIVFYKFALFFTSGVLLIFHQSFLEKAYTFSFSSLSLSFLVPLLIVLCFGVVVYYVTKLFDNTNLLVKDIVEIAMFIGFAIILDFPFLKIRIGANGGSISLVMLPLFYIAFRKGFAKGFLACGLVYGLINCLLDGYGLIYFPFDYLIGYGSVAFVGLFKNKINKTSLKSGYILLVISLILAFVGRTIGSTISGILFYQLDFSASLLYQLVYLGPSFAICGVALLLLFPRFKRVNKVFK